VLKLRSVPSKRRGATRIVLITCMVGPALQCALLTNAAKDQINAELNVVPNVYESIFLIPFLEPVTIRCGEFQFVDCL
jgi:hypothetical protein